MGRIVAARPTEFGWGAVSPFSDPGAAVWRPKTAALHSGTVNRNASNATIYRWSGGIRSTLSAAISQSTTYWPIIMAPLLPVTPHAEVPLVGRAVHV